MNHCIARLTVFPAVVFASVAAHAQTAPDRRYYWHDGWSWGHMILGPLMMIAFIAVVIVVVVFTVRWLGGAGHGAVARPHAPPGETPLDILSERFARGEIDKDEFEERKHALSE
jgi:putative membrane protein